MRKRLLFTLLAVLVLVGCQPRITSDLNRAIGHPEVGMSLTVSDDGYVVLTLEHDGLDLVEPAIAVRGDGVRHNSDSCWSVPGGIDCEPGEIVTVGEEALRVLSGDSGTYMLILAGEDILASASFYVMEDGAVGSRPYFQHASVGE